MSNTERLKTILQIAWPLIIANSFWNLQITIDRIFLGMYSTEALGAAMAVMGVFWVPMALLQQTAGYVTAFVAQYYGAEEKEKIGSSVWQSIYVSIIGGLLILLLNFASAWFFSQTGHSPSVQSLEVEYYNSLAFSALPTALVAAVSGFFTGLGQTRTVTLINLTGLILNVGLDYIFIFGNLGFPKMGAAGAGYATALATYGGAAFGLALIFSRENEAMYRIRSSWRPDFGLIRQFLRFGLPSGFQWALEGLAFTVFLMIMGKMQNGPAVLAASSIAITVMMLSVLPSMGVAQSVMTLVGQHLGSNEPEEAEAVTYGGIKLCLIYMAVIGASFYIIPEFYISWFKNEENILLWKDTQEMAMQILKLVAIFTAMDSVYFNVSFALKGAGDTKFVSLMALTVPWPLFVLPAYLMKDLPNAVFLSWGSVAVYAFIITGILLLRFRGGKWKKMSVIHPAP